MSCRGLPAELAAKMVVKVVISTPCSTHCINTHTFFFIFNRYRTFVVF